MRRVASGLSPSAYTRRPQVVWVSTNHANANNANVTNDP